MKQITESDIENIKSLLKNRNSYHNIKEVLDNLEDAPQEKKDSNSLSKVLPEGTKQGGMESQDDTKQHFSERSASLPVDTSLADILKDIKDLRNHHGKSSIIDADLDKIINKYGEKDG